MGRLHRPGPWDLVLDSGHKFSGAPLGCGDVGYGSVLSPGLGYWEGAGAQIHLCLGARHQGRLRAAPHLWERARAL